VVVLVWDMEAAVDTEEEEEDVTAAAVVIAAVVAGTEEVDAVMVTVTAADIHVEEKVELTREADLARQLTDVINSVREEEQAAEEDVVDRVLDRHALAGVHHRTNVTVVVLKRGIRGEEKKRRGKGYDVNWQEILNTV